MLMYQYILLTKRLLYIQANHALCILCWYSLLANIVTLVHRPDIGHFDIVAISLIRPLLFNFKSDLNTRVQLYLWFIHILLLLLLNIDKVLLVTQCNNSLGSYFEHNLGHWRMYPTCVICYCIHNISHTPLYHKCLQSFSP